MRGTEATASLVLATRQVLGTSSSNCGREDGWSGGQGPLSVRQPLIGQACMSRHAVPGSPVFHFKTPMSAHRIRKGLVAHARAAIIVVHDAGANRATPPHTPRAVKGAQCGQRASQAAKGAGSGETGSVGQRYVRWGAGDLEQSMQPCNGNAPPYMCLTYDP